MTKSPSTSQISHYTRQKFIHTHTRSLFGARILSKKRNESSLSSLLFWVPTSSGHLYVLIRFQFTPKLDPKIKKNHPKCPGRGAGILIGIAVLVIKDDFRVIIALKVVSSSCMFQTPFAGRPWIILLGQKTQNCSWDLTQRCRLYQKQGLVTKSEAQLSLFLLYFSQISYLNDPKENPVLTSTQANKPGQAGTVWS